jgi:hypothetical protein
VLNMMSEPFVFNVMHESFVFNVMSICAYCDI